jgi:putative ABC transport system permease protein
MQNAHEIFHLVEAAFSDFKRSKIRTFLTSLGITIGVLSVVLLIALGLGLKNYINQSFESLGANLVMIMPGSGFGGGGSNISGAGLVSGIKFDERDVATVRRVPEVKYVVPLYFSSATIEADGNKKSGYVMGVNEEFFSLMNSKISKGEVFGKSEVAAWAKVAVLGNRIAGNLFNKPEDAVGRTIRMKDVRFKVIGVVEKTGDNEQDNAVVIPYKTTFASMNPDKTFWAIYLGVESEVNVAEVKKKTEEALLVRYNKDDFSVTEQSELLSTINQIFNIINSVLISIGSISLVVGGIGIMNIMYATVTERTKEIGIRRAVGAREEDIMIQFLMESVLLSLIGGALGLAFAGIIVGIVRFFFPASINLFAVAITLGISSAIGIFFGVFPARRAAKLPPIEAIRYE